MFYSLKNLVEQFNNQSSFVDVFEFLHSRIKQRERKSMKSHQKICKKWEYCM